jgi:hypothetical protein
LDPTDRIVIKIYASSPTNTGISLYFNGSTKSVGEN